MITIRQMIRSGAIAAVIGSGLVLPEARPAGAHAILLQTTPANESLIEAAPGSVGLTFSEPVKASTGGVTAFGPDGERVDRASVTRSRDGEVLDAEIDAGEPGTYTVAWRVTSEDGHTITGAFIFHLQRETGAVEIDDSTPASVLVGDHLGRWLVFAGSLVVIGALAVHRLAGGPAEAGRRLQRLARGAAGAAAGGAALALLAAAAEAGGRSLVKGFELLGDFVSDQRTGTLGAMRLAALVVAAAAVALPAVWRRAAALPALAVTGGLVTTSLAGHAWTTSPRWGTVTSDVVHQGAVGIWAGGLLALLVALPLAADRGRLARRFSALALITVAVVAVSGSISGFTQVRSFEALTSTGYGRLLAAKVAVFGVLLAFGWYNRTRLLARVEAGAGPLVRSLRAEVLVAGVVVAVTTVLVVQPPARVALSTPYATTVTEATGTLEVSVLPARVGVNEVHLYFFTPDGATPASVDAVEVEAATGQIPPRRLNITPVSPNHVSAYGAALTSPGEWTLAVTAIQAGAASTFSVKVPIR